MKIKILIIAAMMLLIPHLVFADHESTPKQDMKIMIGVAEDFAQRQHINLSEYYIYSVEWKMDQREWVVHFISRLRPEGDVFWIRIDDNMSRPPVILYGE